MNRPVRWGIVGTGVVARRFTASLALCPDAEAVAVAARNPAHAEAFARDFRIARSHASLEGLVSDADVDVAYIATPTELHAEHSLLCLEHGKDVLCEKPLARTAAEAAAVVRSARGSNRFLMEGMWTRFLPLMDELRERLAANAIGALRLLQADLSYPSNGGGDPLLDLGVYPLALAFDLLGPPESVDARVLADPGRPCSQAALTLNYPEAQAVLTCGDFGRGRNDATLMGDRGRIHLEEPLPGCDAMVLTTWPEGGAHKANVTHRLARNPFVAGLYRRLLPTARKVLGRDRRIRRTYPSFGYQFEAAEVVRCVRAGLGESERMPLDESLAILEVLDRVRESRPS